MNDVVNTIIQVERECSEKIDAAGREGEKAIGNYRVRMESEKKEEMKRIAAENGNRYKLEIERIEGEIDRELARLKEDLGRLRENSELRDEVREKIISLISTEL